MAAEARRATLIPIRNMNRAVKFYSKVLGAKLEMRAPGEMRDFWAALKVGGADVWLIAPKKREKTALASSAFLVKEIRAFVGRLKRNGARFSRPEPMNKEARIDGPIAYDPIGASAFFKDSEGNLMLIWQSPRAREARVPGRTFAGRRPTRSEENAARNEQEGQRALRTHLRAGSLVPGP